ncbi:MAG TPA: Na+/H+ antiporter [Saprospiraceae bacterium]|nr:Na+/H+ antiporter [Saprospiraceae bacterium]
MQDQVIEYVYLAFIIVALVMIANKLRIAYPIILVLGGLALSFMGIFTDIKINPELIFFIFLPPLLYEAAWQVSFREFWRLRRVIASFAFPIVILTACVVAFASQALIPGFTLALGFLLGGIVSPPDAISATTIMRTVKAPKSLLSIIEGESLLNDASSLIVFRFALAAVITGQFYFVQATGSFFLVIIMGTLIGLGIAMIFYLIHRWLPTTPAIEIVLSFLAPYCMYYFAELFHFSGVLAVVAGGLLLSSKRQKMLTYQGRVQGYNVWSTLGFILNGLIFLLIGLQLPSITRQLGDVSLQQAVLYGLIISLVLIITRLACTLGASLFTMFMSRFIKVAEANPGWKGPIIFGWAGMRGVVSLAAALSIPVFLQDGNPFPFRNLILVITFVVILVTLVFQGLTLPWVIRKLTPTSNGTSSAAYKQDLMIRQKITQASIQFMEEKYIDAMQRNEHVHNLHDRFKIDLKFFNHELEETNNNDKNSIAEFQHIYLELLEEQRRMLDDLNVHAEFDEELIRKYFSLIDLEEYKIREKLLLGGNKQ